MSETDKPIEVFYDMEIAQICQHFGKTRNTVDKAIAKLVKDNPDKDWKYKNPETKRITIRAEGVEQLSGYFRKEKNEVSAVETELRYENDKLKALLEEKDKMISKLDVLYTERLKLELEKKQQTFLIETKSQQDRIESLEAKNAELMKECEQTSENQSSLELELEEMKKQRDEYNKKSFFYRMTHKFMD